MTDRPNILLIMADQWRGDCLSIDGHPVVHTPTLDNLALSGTRFGRAYSANPVCIPARISLMTGLSCATHGVVGFNTSVPWDFATTLAGEFTRHGYQTQAVGKMHAEPPRAQVGFQNVVLHSALGIVRDAMKKGMDPGMVDDYIPWLRERLGPGATPFEHGLDSNSVVARPWDKAEELHYTNFTVTQSLEFLRRRDPTKPFFLFTSFNAPHPPFDPPGWAFDMYMNMDLPEPPVGDWVDAFADQAQPHSLSPSVAKLDPRVLRRNQAGYYGHITHVDHQINRLLEGLAQYGVRDNTYICFVSDHGELLGDHHLFRKAKPYEGSARVPLILVGPRNSGIKRNHRVVDHVVELRDIFPTLLECAGLPVPEGLEGRSFLPLARGEECPGWRTYLHGENTSAGRSMQWLTDGREKYVWFSDTGREQLFDLVNDPKETVDLARRADCARRVEHWRNILVAELKGREEGYSDGVRLIPGRPPTTVLAHARERMNRWRERQLKA